MLLILLLSAQSLLMILKCNFILFFFLVTGISFADATETGTPILKLGGVGTLGVTHSSQNMGDYVLDSTIPEGAGRSHDWAAGNDSRIGVQMTANFTPEISAVLQLISEYQANNTYRPTTEWANIKYAITPNSYIRVGRIALPTFINSDSRKVGYSYPWIHPPVDLYRQLAITNSDGINVMYRFEIGEAQNSIKAIYGSNTLERPTSISTSRGMWGVFDTLEYGSASFLIGYQKRESSTFRLITGVTEAWIPNSDLSIGASYDPGDWFVMSEWIQRQSTIKVDAMYISAGLRVDKFTPYLTYSQGSQGSLLPDFAAQTASTYQNAVQLAQRSQSTVSLGTRWDFLRNTDLKLQYDRIQLSDYSNGYLTNVPTGTNLYGTNFHLISAAIDFVF